MIMIWRRTNGKQEAPKREGIIQQEEAWVTIVKKDTIAHPFIHRQFLQNAASRCIILDVRTNKFHLGKFGHLDMGAVCWNCQPRERRFRLRGPH